MPFRIPWSVGTVLHLAGVSSQYLNDMKPLNHFVSTRLKVPQGGSRDYSLALFCRLYFFRNASIFAFDALSRVYIRSALNRDSQIFFMIDVGSSIIGLIPSSVRM